MLSGIRARCILLSSCLWIHSRPETCRNRKCQLNLEEWKDMSVVGKRPEYITGPLADFWDKPVSQLAELPPVSFSPEEKERHRLYSLLAMALVSFYWNGNKRGPDGQYPWREAQRLSDGRYEGVDYLGHNIASIAVDGAGRVIDFDFNHNVIFSSSVEHAESRLIRRVFSLVQLRDDWRPPISLGFIGPTWKRYVTSLSDVTVYTTLEPCAQCAGIMALGQVRAVVYLQRDPGMYMIGNILRNLTSPDARAPNPIPACDFDFDQFESLNDGYRKFAEEIPHKPFHIEANQFDKASSVTSFLCTDDARRIFRGAEAELKAFKVSYPDFCLADAAPPPGSAVLSNEDVLQHLRQFFNYAISKGQRATPHQV